MRPVLVTGGATRNPVDAIRYLSARSTGRTAVALATRLQAHLLGSAEACLRAPPGLSAEEYGSTRDLMARMERWVRAHPGGTVLHAAAVGDYECAPTDDKIPSGQASVTLTLTPTPKIVDRVRDWDPGVFLVSFKAGRPGLAEAELEAVARAQLRRTRSDVVFANTIGALETVLLVSEPTTERYAREAAIDALVTRAGSRS